MRFIAIPVGQGDSFYAETDEGFRVLVDGGRSRKVFPELFRRWTKADGVDVLVCTHNDADHAGGVIGFLEGGLRCGELWLPATWLDALRNLPTDPAETLGFLARCFEKASERGARSDADGSLQERAWQILYPEFPREALTGSENEGGSALDGAADFLGELLGEEVRALRDHLEAFSWISWWRFRWQLLYGEDQAPLLAFLLRDARRLLELALLAMDHGVAVRSFLFAPHEALPIRNCPLVPLSGRAVRRVRRPSWPREARNFWQMAYLTQLNRESFVCYLRGKNGQPVVLFTADSDLEGIALPKGLEEAIVTAPHHGSAENSAVYGKLPGTVVWVRSDGYSRHRPCDAYLTAGRRRFCTLCRNSSHSKQAVRLYVRRRRCTPLRTRPCSCQ